MIKLAAFDVDGTLRERDYLPDSTRTALQKLKENGVALALCTGRSEFEVKSLREELGIDWAITCNGSHVGYRGETVFGSTFPAETVRGWLREAERSGHGLILYGAELMYTNRRDNPYFAQAQQEIGFMEPVLLQSMDEVPDIYQAIVFCGEHEEAAYTAGGKDLYYLHRWRPWAIDINPGGMNKAVGLQRLLDHLGISSEEVAAFGDGLNDYEMIESVGYGIAMGNAGDELKEKARFVTKPMMEDGIAYAVNEWIVK
ncbi:Putative bifunctional phosphatase/peptidyl-prolyl cis-trans isomerase [Paenibacillus solanacearum]|uniref:Bifunctional phosphatase/peptidyl-prolyl cis-trans isomerase n=1 Tax=Paenibacillus solanacearum TaxID=2048548 RepID=A0A916K0U0_9BACL|nr:Cof-type HAD-IIB family hydrolase [Paenibacillus solanacearum]CAG7616067.1 Putative bifunctional phosphatase/peptidyl-prolyl cis-trans isomerase [Paenibacillus solanacearum]